MKHVQTILVVEDEAVVRNIIVAVLVRGDYRVLEADSAAEALEVSNTFEHPIDLLIADHAFEGNDRPADRRKDMPGPSWHQGRSHIRGTRRTCSGRNKVCCPVVIS